MKAEAPASRSQTLSWLQSLGKCLGATNFEVSPAKFQQLLLGADQRKDNFLGFSGGTLQRHSYLEGKLVLAPTGDRSSEVSVQTIGSWGFGRHKTLKSSVIPCQVSFHPPHCLHAEGEFVLGLTGTRSFEVSV